MIPVYAALGVIVLVIVGAALVSGVGGSPAPLNPNPTPVNFDATPGSGTPAATQTPLPGSTPTPLSTLVPTPTSTPGPVSTATPRPTLTATPVPTPTPRPGRPMNTGVIEEHTIERPNRQIGLQFDHQTVLCELRIEDKRLGEGGFVQSSQVIIYRDIGCEGKLDIVWTEDFNERGPENEIQFLQWDANYEGFLMIMGLWEFV